MTRKDEDAKKMQENPMAGVKNAAAALHSDPQPTTYDEKICFRSKFYGQSRLKAPCTFLKSTANTETKPREVAPATDQPAWKIKPKPTLARVLAKIPAAAVVECVA